MDMYVKSAKNGNKTFPEWIKHISILEMWPEGNYLNILEFWVRG